MSKYSRISLIVLTFIVLGCGTTADPVTPAVPEEQAPFYFAVVSDTHVWPEEAHENNRLLAETGQLLATLEPPIEFAVASGDNVHDLFCVPGATCEDPLLILEVFRELLLTSFSVPVYVVKGNHDNRYFDTFLENDAPNRSWLSVFEGTGLFPAPYYAFDQGSFSFIVLDGTDLAYDHESNDEATFGEAQLAWLEEELERGRPSILFWHQHLFPSEVDEAALPPILSIIDDHRAVVRAVFMGHGHDFRRETWRGVQFFETDATSGAEHPTYHLVRCDPASGETEIANEGEILYVGE